MKGLFDIAATLLILGGLVYPGASWAMAWRWPAPWLAGFVFSMLGLFATLLACAAAGLPITALTLGAGQVLLLAGGAWLAWRRRDAAPREATARGAWWLALPALPMLVVLAWRAFMQPLPGADVDFRWNYLAELIVETGRLDYYPPASAAAFSHYFWADGIAPLVSVVYSWTYLVAGNVDKSWTALPMILQTIVLLGLLSQLGRVWGGTRGGWFACALGGGTMLLQFALGLGQETGLTALGAGGMILFLTHWQRERHDHLLVPAAACAALVACAREYGSAYLVLGAAWVAWAGGGRRSALFLLGGGLLPGLWHLRVFLMTGNPLYAHGVLGLFSSNHVFGSWMDEYVRLYGAALREAAGWREIGRLVLLTAAPSLAGFLAAAWVCRREAGWFGWMAAGGLTVAVWLVSVPQTAGGIFYSMRVLTPLLVLGSAGGGACLARWVPGSRHLAGLMIALALLGCGATVRAWGVSINDEAQALRQFERGEPARADHPARGNLEFLAEAARLAEGRVLSESAGAQRIFRRQGRQLMPFWSPDVHFLFEPADPGDVAARLRGLGYSHVLLTRAQSTFDFLNRTGALARIRPCLRPVASNETFILFALVPAPDASVR